MPTNKHLIWISTILLLVITMACQRPEVNRDPTDLVDERDGQRYSTEKYGTQRWMAENLAYNFTGSKVNPDNPFSEYGRLYSYDQALLVCPDGWHLPTDSDWQVLERYLGVDANALGFVGHRGGTIGGKLKASSGWVLNNGTNQLLFNAYPAGSYVQQDQRFENLGEKAEFWSATASTTNKAYMRNLTKDFDTIFRGDARKENYLSCRCVKNE